MEFSNISSFSFQKGDFYLSTKENDLYKNRTNYKPSRFVVATTVNAPDSELHLVNGELHDEPIGRSRASEKSEKAQNETKIETVTTDKKEPLRLPVSLCVSVCIILTFAWGVVLLGKYGQITSMNNNISTLIEAIQSCEAENYQLELDIADNSDQMDILDKASDYDMMPSKEAATIYLKAQSLQEQESTAQFTPVVDHSMQIDTSHLPVNFQ